MIPLRLNPRNFMCYGEVHQPLVFDGIRVACLSGQNGHGKSALLDAMTWALWGRSRARSDNDLVHLAPGCTEMEVEFEFKLGDQQYRVIRKRNKRGRGQSVLELAVLDGEAYRPLTGSSVAETERQIRELLRMSYETFTNASFILQNKADSFTTRTPGERKQVLAEILDLSYYDRLEERVRQKMSERNEQHAVLKQQIQDDDLELQEQGALRERQGVLETELGRLDECLRLAEAREEAVRERVNRLKAGQQELLDLERRLEELRGRASRQRTLAANAEARLEHAGAILGREAEIERGQAELVERRRELERLTEQQAEYGRLQQDIAQREQAIAQARGRLEGQLQQLRGRLRSVGTDAARLEQYEADLAAARQERDELERLETERADLDAELRQARERYLELKGQRDSHDGRLKELHEREALLADSPTCPVCRTPLKDDRHREVLGQYRREAEHFADLRRKAAHEVQQLEASGKQLKAKLAELDRQLERRKANQERLAQAERALARAQEQVRTLDELKTEVARVERELKEEDYAHQEREELALIQRQAAGLGYDRDHHRQVAAAVNELTRYEALRQELLEARRTLEREREARDEARRALAEVETDIAAAERRRAELRTAVAELATAETELAGLESELRQLRLEQGRLNQDVGAVRQRLNTMAFIAERRRERLAELDRVLAERGYYQELALAFGKKGLQAMLIETAIPELQDEANRLLGLVTDGRMHVSFETQRAAKSGDGTIETLDIIINDERGARPYELYSGGEAFRVNFAIRIALSKLLARRAGARLQTLVIDEGFGSQDEQGKERLVEAIKVIQDEFERILVVTHLSDLKDLFDVRIDVTKTPLGSVIEVS